MDELGRLIHEAIDRGMVAAGWRRCTWAHADVFERPEAPPFVLRAQYWVDDTSGQVQALLSLTCLAADAALAELAEDLVSAVTRDPLAGGVSIARAHDVEAVDQRFDAAAEELRPYADVDTFAEALGRDEDTRAEAAVVVPVLLAVTGRRREARARARGAPGDFAERLDRWLAGERPRRHRATKA